MVKFGDQVRAPRAGGRLPSPGSGMVLDQDLAGVNAAG